MRSINKVILIGNLTRDPELRQTGGGQSVVTFGLATNREWVTRDGRKMNSAEYHELVAWAKLADICRTYLKKGKLIYVEGYLKTRSWDMPDGSKKFRTEVVVQDMIMLDKRGEGEDYIPEEGGNSGHSEHSGYSEPAQERSVPKKEIPAPKKEEKKNEPPAATEKEPVSVPSGQPLDIDSDLGL